MVVPVIWAVPYSAGLIGGEGASGGPGVDLLPHG